MNFSYSFELEQFSTGNIRNSIRMFAEFLNVFSIVVKIHSLYDGSYTIHAELIIIVLY